MAAGKPLASFENPAYTGARSLNRTGPVGALHDSVNTQLRVEAITTAESTPGANKPMNLLYRTDNRYSEPLRPYSRSAWIASVASRVRAITAAAKHEEIQQD